jgi:hypothetical protein
MIDLVAAQVSNAWWYVGVAYTVILGGMAMFIAWLRVRLRRAHRELDQLT